MWYVVFYVMCYVCTMLLVLFVLCQKWRNKTVIYIILSDKCMPITFVIKISAKSVKRRSQILPSKLPGTTWFLMSKICHNMNWDTLWNQQHALFLVGDGISMKNIHSNGQTIHVTKNWHTKTPAKWPLVRPTNFSNDMFLCNNSNKISTIAISTDLPTNEVQP